MGISGSIRRELKEWLLRPSRITKLLERGQFVMMVLTRVTGRAQYGADLNLTGMLHGKVLRSPYAHARIRSICTEEALKLPGVKAVTTAADIPHPADKLADMGEASMPLKYLSNNVFARDKVLYQGHAVAAVAATNVHIAEEALSLIEVEYDPLPPAVTVLEAMKEDAPILHDDLRTQFMGTAGDEPTNIAEHFQFRLGDPDKAFQEADIVIEREFNTATVHQGYIEPQTATAFWNMDGQLTIWTSTQGFLHLPADGVRYPRDSSIQRQGGADGNWRWFRR